MAREHICSNNHWHFVLDMQVQVELLLQILLELCYTLDAELVARLEPAMLSGEAWVRGGHVLPALLVGFKGLLVALQRDVRMCHVAVDHAKGCGVERALPVCLEGVLVHLPSYQ